VEELFVFTVELFAFTVELFAFTIELFESLLCFGEEAHAGIVKQHTTTSNTLAITLIIDFIISTPTLYL
jgi:hypothetical protein